MNQRDNNYDLLRCICAVMIVVLHAGAFYQQSPLNEYASTGVFFQAISRTAVPCFVMLSGAFLLGDEKWLHYSFALSKTKKIILMPTGIYSLVFIFLSFITYRLGVSAASYKEVVVLALQGYPYPHMWYMFMCLGLYLATPLIWKLKSDILDMGEKKLVALVVSLLILGCIVQGTSDLIWIVKFIPYIGYFMFGDLVRRYYVSMEKKHISWNALIVWIVFISFSCWLQLYAPNWKYWGGLHTDPLNPIIILSSLGCFTFFSSLSIKWPSFNLAKHTSMIYLVHIVPLQVIKLLMEKLNGGRLLQPIIGMPLMVIGAMVASLIYSIVINQMKSKLRCKN